MRSDLDDYKEAVVNLLRQIERNTRKDNIPILNYNILDTIRDNFYSALWMKSDWQISDIKEVFENSIAKSLGKDSF